MKSKVCVYIYMYIYFIYHKMEEAGGDGDNRGWDGWMASLTWWTWVWVNSGSWWWAGRPGVLQFMGLQRVGHDWATELNWTDSIVFRSSDVNRRLIEKVPDAGKDQEQKEKRASEDEMAGWHHWCGKHELGKTLGDGEVQGGLACCSPRDHKELDMTGNWTTTIAQWRLFSEMI